MLENYVNKSEKAFKKTLHNEACYLATSNRKKGGMNSVVRNIIMVSEYFDIDTKTRKVLNVPKRVGRVGMDTNKK
jgi:hypothetical protein